MRYLGISNLAIQTAGYSGQAEPEIRIEAIEHAEELRELIPSMVRGSPHHDDGTGSGTPSSISGSSVDQQILGELKEHPVSPRETLKPAFSCDPICPGENSGGGNRSKTFYKNH